MLAAEEMGHKGVRAMSPLDLALANALRTKLGKGRELPVEEAKPKRVRKPTTAQDGTPEEGVEGEIVAKKPARPRKPKTTADEPAELKPAATIIRPKPAEAAEPEPLPEVVKPAAELVKPAPELPRPVVE